MRAVRIRVAAVYLREALNLPPQTEIIAAGTFHEHGQTSVEFTVSHPDLPMLPPGARPPLAEPLFTKESVPIGEIRLEDVSPPTRTRLVEWGLLRSDT